MKINSLTTMVTSVSLLSGAALGLGAGFLFAPQSGARTRRKIKTFYEDTKENIETQTKDVKESVEQNINKGRSLLLRWLDKPKSGKQTLTTYHSVEREGIPIVF